jgi:hypothetical protein
MKNKFNIGDEVMIRTGLKVGDEYGDLTYSSRMNEHAGKTYKIQSCIVTGTTHLYTLENCLGDSGFPWVWSEEMLTASTSWRYPLGPKFKKGDSVYLPENFDVTPGRVSAGVYEVLDAIFADCTAWYTLKGAPMIWVPEARLQKKTSEPKFNTGDKVRIKTDLKVGEKYGGITYCESRAKYAGKCYKVLYRALEEPHFLYTLNDCRRVDHGDWLWSEEMLESAKEDEPYTKPQEFKDDDYVYLLDKFGLVSYESASSIFRNVRMDNRCFSNGQAAIAYKNWTRPIADMCRFKQEKDAFFISTEDNPGYVIDFLPYTGTFGVHELHRPCEWMPTFSAFDLALECAHWINNKYHL